MSVAVLGELNWLAVIVSTIAFFALGGLWYSNALFGSYQPMQVSPNRHPPLPGSPRG